LLTALALPVRSPAQRPDRQIRVDSGRIVRLHTATDVTVGRLLAPLSHTDSLVHFCRYPGPPCLDPGDARAIPVAEVLHLDLRQGSAARKGALIGGIIGAVVGALGGVVTAGLTDCTHCGSAETYAVRGALLTGAVGAGIGALFGSTSLHWKVGPW
jgi:hypothetical protein